MSEHIGLLVLLGLVLLAVIPLGTRLNKLERRLARLSGIDAKLDLLLSHSGLRYDPFKNVPPAVLEALRNDRKIEAIKIYREETGVGLKEAKDFVEEVQRRAGGA